MPRGKWERGTWPEEIRIFIRENASDQVRMKDMQQMILERFGKEYTYGQVKGYYFRNSLPFRRNSRHNLIMTDEMAEYLVTIIPGRSSADCALMLNEKYGSSYTNAQIRGWKKNHKTPSGYSTKFRPGEKSWITGKRFPGRTNSGCFLVGHRSANAAPIGSERKSEKYTYVKVADGKKNRNWKAKHRMLWEEHNGPVPEGYNVIFLDGNPDNIVIENLALVNQQEMYYAGVKHGLTNDRELSRSIVALARLDAAIHNAEKKVKK